MTTTIIWVVRHRPCNPKTPISSFVLKTPHVFPDSALKISFQIKALWIAGSFQLMSWNKRSQEPPTPCKVRNFSISWSLLGTQPPGVPTWKNFISIICANHLPYLDSLSGHKKIFLSPGFPKSQVIISKDYSSSIKTWTNFLTSKSFSSLV